MNITSSCLNNRYKIQGIVSGDILSCRQEEMRESEKQNSNLKQKVKMITNNRNNNAASNSNSILESMKQYGESIRNQRQNAAATTTNVKHLNYKFKGISSQIIRSKTSTMARQAVIQAKREILRLKREKISGKYDSEEIDAAINHAKAIERVARKKVKHLEEEELAKACGISVEEEEREAITDASQDKGENGRKSLDSYEENDRLTENDNEFNIDQATMFDEELNMNKTYGFPYDFVSIGIGDSLNDGLMADLIDNSEILGEDILEDFTEGLEELLEDIGLEELEDSVISIKPEMNSEDIKMMEIKHRNKEMKDMVKADSDYLKAMFEYLNKLGDGQISNIDYTV